MKQAHIDQILQHQAKIIQDITSGIESDLESCTYIISDMKEKIISGLRWGLFMRNKVDDKIKEKIQTRTSWDEKQDTYYDYSDLVQISCAEIFEVQEEIKKIPEILDFCIFSPLIEKELIDKKISIKFSYENLETTIFTATEHGQPDTDKILDVFELRLTLPEYDMIFDDCEDLMKIQQWLFEYIDIYEQWMWKIQCQRDSYVQIGGFGRWIQGSYKDSYIAQVNNEVGDAGAVFICLQEDKTVGAWVDMH